MVYSLATCIFFKIKKKNKKNAAWVSHYLATCIFWKNKIKKRCGIVTVWEAYCCHSWSRCLRSLLMESLLSLCKIFFFLFWSQPHMSFLLICLLLSYSYFSYLDFCSSHLSDSVTQSLISHQPPSFFFQTLISPNKHLCFPFNLRISGSHLTIFLFSFALSHIMFLPNPNPTKQLVVSLSISDFQAPTNHFSLLFCNQPYNFFSIP